MYQNGIQVWVGHITSLGPTFSQVHFTFIIHYIGFMQECVFLAIVCYLCKKLPIFKSSADQITEWSKEWLVTFR